MSNVEAFAEKVRGGISDDTSEDWAQAYEALDALLARLAEAEKRALANAQVAVGMADARHAAEARCAEAETERDLWRHNYETLCEVNLAVEARLAEVEKWESIAAERGIRMDEIQERAEAAEARIAELEKVAQSFGSLEVVREKVDLEARLAELEADLKAEMDNQVVLIRERDRWRKLYGIAFNDADRYKAALERIANSQGERGWSAFARDALRAAATEMSVSCQEPELSGLVDGAAATEEPEKGSKANPITANDLPRTLQPGRAYWFQFLWKHE